MGDVKDILLRPDDSGRPPVYYPTGCLLLDMVLGGAPGCYGFRGGVLTGIFGINQAGKSFLMGETIGACHHKLKGFQHKYQDIERRFRFNTLGMYGVQVVTQDSKERMVETIEELDADLGVWLDTHTYPAMYVTDSLDALSNDDAEAAAVKRKADWEGNKDVTDAASYGTGPAKFLSQHFFKTKMAAISKTDVALIFLSQVRVNLGGGQFGPKHKRSGGDALDHWCDTTLQLKMLRKITSGPDDIPIGVVVEAKTTKSSTPRPFRSCVYTLYFDYGIDDIGSSLDYLFDLRCMDGKDIGKLLSAANEIAWSGKPKTLPAIKAFLEQRDALTRSQKAKKADTGRANLSLEWLLEWVPGQQDLADDFLTEFGSGITASRDELIRMIEASQEMREELRNRVIAKWESAEAEVATAPTRSKKYT